MKRSSQVLTLDEYFAGFPDSREIFDTLLPLLDALSPLELTVTKSQIAFRAGRQFAWVWIPEKHLHHKAAPLVLSLSFPFRDISPRWKEIVEPAQGRFMHHLELYSTADIDAQVAEWLKLARLLAE